MIVLDFGDASDLRRGAGWEVKRGAPCGERWRLSTMVMTSASASIVGARAACYRGSVMYSSHHCHLTVQATQVNSQTTVWSDIEAN
jgi:hypothetical protein